MAADADTPKRRQSAGGRPRGRRPQAGDQDPPGESAGKPDPGDELDDSLGMEIRRTLQAKARKMLDEMRNSPDSEAGQMVYILLINELATMEGRLSERDLKSVFDEERRRYDLSKTVELQRSVIALRDAKLRQATQRVNQNADRMGRARDLATFTQHQLEAGKDVDMRGVCRRIAEIVGLRPPPQLGTG